MHIFCVLLSFFFKQRWVKVLHVEKADEEDKDALLSQKIYFFLIKLSSW